MPIGAVNQAGGNVTRHVIDIAIKRQMNDRAITVRISTHEKFTLAGEQSDVVEQNVLVVIGEPPIGYAIVTWSWSLESGGRDCILDELYVTSRGGGLGTRLMTEVINHARRAGAAAMFLETEAPNRRARHFYEQLGFQNEDSSWLSRDL